VLKIDKKDRKILYHLDLNCRQSNTQIGKKIGLGRDVVAYRIKRMEDEGLIKNFWTAINTFKLGYMVFRIYINFQYVNPDIKNDIIQHFVDYKNVWSVLSVRAEVDFDVVLWVKDIYEFYQFWDKTLDRFEDYFAKYTISVYIGSFNYKKSYLLPDETKKYDRELYSTTCRGKPVDIDEIDYQLLNKLVVNARIPLIDLADKLGCSSQAANYRIKKLFKNEVIQAFRVNIDLTKFGLQHYKLDVYLKDHKQKRAIWNYLKDTPYVVVLNIAVGWCDLEFEVVVKNVDSLSQIMYDIDSKFPNAIKKQNFWITEKVHKIRWLPEL
jgi:DNA-binding Lrp family transcriptional regulator